GPASINPDTGKPYGLSFPIVTIRDFVRVQKALIDSLGIKKLVAAGGVSMGGMQSYEWAAAYPEMVERVFAVNSTSSQQASARVALEAWVAPIKVDAKWNHGNYYGGPEPIDGLTAALFNVTVDALHHEYLAAAFGYQWADPNKDPLESLENDFLSVQSIKAMSLLRATTTVDANNMLYMTRANQLFVAGTPGSSVEAQLKNIKAKVLVIQARTDLLFASEYAKAEVAQLQKNGTQAEFVEFDSGGGHLSGITEVAKAGDAIRKFLTN
ncbi:MAG: alpha/beta fold hydrolase, partial [Burkholderiaceae bacterium]